jgi:hypothetical protein
MAQGWPVFASLPAFPEPSAPPVSSGGERRGLVRIFRMLLLLQIAFDLAIVPLVLTDQRRLPAELQDYAVKMPIDRPFFIVTAAVCVLIAILWTGLWHFRRWARLLYSLGLAGALVVASWYGEPDVRSALTTLVTDIARMFDGAVLVFMWAVLRQEFGGHHIRSGRQPLSDDRRRNLGAPAMRRAKAGCATLAGCAAC